MFRFPLLLSALTVAMVAGILAGMQGLAPTVEAQQGGIIGGNKPPAGGGFGTFIFGGGTSAQLLAASECAEETATFFYNKPDGTFAVYIPAALDVANEEFVTLFPNDMIPTGSIFTGKCVSLQNVLAPIESVEVRIAESFPPQYFLDVVSGLPSGCATFDRYEVERAGTDIMVTVWNLEPAPGPTVFCTAIYGYVEHAIALGSDFERGTTYTVRVNDVTATFVAQ